MPTVPAESKDLITGSYFLKRNRTSPHTMFKTTKICQLICIASILLLHIPDKHCSCDANVKHSKGKINKIFTPNLFTLPNSTAVISKQNYKPSTTAILNIFKQCFERSNFTILGRISPLSTERRWPEANSAGQFGLCLR